MNTVLAIFSTMIFAQVSATLQTDLKKDNLRGHIENTTEITYNLKKDTTSPTAVIEKTETSYDPNGFTTLSRLNSAIVKDQGESFLEKAYTYDKDHRPIVCVSVRDYGLSFTDSLFYDQQGRNITILRYQTTRLVMKTTKMYDEQGRELLESYFDTDSGRFTYTGMKETNYPAPGQTHIRRLMANGEYEDVTTTCDDNGKPIKVKQMDKYGTSRQEWIWTYDKLGNVIKLEEAKGNKTELIERYEYKIDDAANWIEKVTYDGKNKLVRKTFREIKYYRGSE